MFGRTCILGLLIGISFACFQDLGESCGILGASDESCIRDYTVDVYTSARKFWANGGTNDTVTLVIKGVTGDTYTQTLHRIFELDVGSKFTYTVKGPVIGELLHVRLEKQGGDDWHLDKIVVTEEDGHVTKFPHYGWVDENIVRVRTGAAVLPFKDTYPGAMRRRRAELRDRRKLVQYNPVTLGLPGYINASQHADLPRFLQFHDTKAMEWGRNAVEAKKMFGMSAYLEKDVVWDKPEKLADIALRYTTGEELKFIKMLLVNWDKDEEFGRQMLNGINPNMIRRCDKLPAHFKLTDDMVENYMDRSLTFSKVMKKGYVYVIDYGLLEGLPRYSKGDDVRYCAEPTVILYVRSTGELVPIAIKLDQKLESPVWLPSDGLGWTLAKLYVKNADSQIQQMGAHLLKTHLVTESIAIAMFRSLPTVHPVYKLLVPHIRHTVAVNTIGRISLVGHGGLADKTMSIAGDGASLKLSAKVFESFNWDDLHVQKDFERRGVANRGLLPNYRYRDDALKLWNAIYRFTKDLMGIYYKSNNDIRRDYELQSFIKLIRRRGLPNEGEADRRVPGSIHNMRTLCNVLTSVVFTASCQHAAVNFGQYKYMAFVTNYPNAMRKPYPTTKSDIKIEDIMEALPGKALTTQAVALARILTHYSDTEVYLGDYREEYFTELKAKQAQKMFRARLRRITAKIKKRNEGLAVKYDLLQPNTIPSNTEI